MATLLPARLIPVNCAQLQLGMYVAELDRSWLHTSFHAHGFMLSHSEQIEELQRLCDYVYVDPVLSEQLGNDEFFSTGLTARVEALATVDTPTPLARQRFELRPLGHAFADAVQGVRRSQDLSLAPLRRALEPVVASLLTDATPSPGCSSRS
ncbi:MAG: DUF3391 domain-containing protein [Rhodopseudomonas palustris]|nr:DUF3391 domain-containing protein [Rhodopseudomonas palustris]